MSLINCPECQKEISDKAASCPHCGYPIENNQSRTPDYIKNINGKDYDLRNIADFMNQNKKIQAIHELRVMTGLSPREVLDYLDKTNWKDLNSSALRCPMCNSSDIEAISGFKKGASALAFGAFAANTVLSKYKCKKCGHKF